MRKGLHDLDIYFKFVLPNYVVTGLLPPTHCGTDSAAGCPRPFQEGRQRLDLGVNIGHLLAEFKSKVESLDLLQTPVVDPAEHQPDKAGDSADNSRHSADDAERRRTEHVIILPARCPSLAEHCICEGWEGNYAHCRRLSLIFSV